MDELVHLHTHSMASLLDGLPTPQEIIDRVAQLNQPAVALTDHGTMSGALRFVTAAKEKGINPLVGVEAYLTDDIENKTKESATYHLGLIARTNEGLRNLYALSDIAWNQGYYKKPRIDLATLDSHREGITALTGCMNGCVADNIRNGNIKMAESWRKNLMDVCEDVLIEIQPWNPGTLNEDLIELNNDEAPVVVTADTHFCTQDDAFAEEVNLLVQIHGDKSPSEKKRLEESFKESRKIPGDFERIDFLHPNRGLTFKGIHPYIMSRRNLETKFPEGNGYLVPEHFSNTVDFASRCDIQIPTNVDYFPIFSRTIRSDEYLREIALEGLEKLGLDTQEPYVERLDEELTIINKLNFSDYMLVVWDTVAWAKSKNILVGPGRGSVGGSLLAYVLGITEVDPLEHGLLFWRFLNVAVDYKPEFEEIDAT